MKFTDILELAKQGYKPADIKELMALNTENSQEIPKGEADTGEDHERDDATQEPNPTEENLESNADSIDYKKLYEDSLAKLAEAQKNNINQSQPKAENYDDILAETIKGFM